MGEKVGQGVVEKLNVSLHYSFLFKCSQQGTSLVLGIVLARILSPAEFGVVAIANMVVFYANSFTNFGLNNALVQKKIINNSHINTVFTVNLGLSCLLLGGTFVMADSVAMFFKSPDVSLVLKWMSLYYIITSFSSIPAVILRRKIDFKFLSAVEFWQGLLTSVVAIGFALNGYSYWAIVISSLLLPFLTTFVLVKRTGWIPNIKLSPDMGEIYSFGAWVFVRNQIELLVAKVDYFVIGRYLDVSCLGIYEKSFELSERAISGFSSPLNAVFYSGFCRLQDNVLEVKKIFLQGSLLLALVCYPVLFGLLGVAPHFVMSCLGEQWRDAILPIQILSLACVFRVLFGLVASLNVAIGKQKLHTMITAGSALCFVFLCFFLVHYGVVAVCWAFFFYCLISFVASFMLVYINVRISPFELFTAVWCPLVGSSLMLIVVFCASEYVFLNDNSLLELLFLVVIGAAIYMVWCYFFYRIGVISLKVSLDGEDQ